MYGAVNDAIVSWVLDAGYGEITSSNSAGSSGWASFQRIEVSQPPRPGLSFFVKTSTRTAKEMFEGEALGLRAMLECSTYNSNSEEDDSSAVLKIPEVFHWGDKPSGGSFLVMEYLNLGGRSGGKNGEYAFGRAMAKMHSTNPVDVPGAGNPEGKYGFNLENTIGGTPQPNPWTEGGTTEDWIQFYSDERIGHQLQLAGDTSLLKLWTNDVAPRLHLLFEGITIRPSLLHGDLWSGNIGSASDQGTSLPTIYDPAVYWGHHEAEWGMSWCASFGGSFWDGYRSVLPEDKGFQDRKPLYDAYHQLNHYNLFGGGYLSSARSQLQQVKRNLDKKK